MSVPKQRHTKGRRDKKRKRLIQKPVDTVLCSECAQPTRAHHACAKCGKYKGKEVINMVKREERKLVKEKK